MNIWIKWLIGVVGAIVLILAIGSWYLSRHYKPILKDKLSEKVNAGSQGLYRLVIGDLDVSILHGTLRFTDIRLESDTAIYAVLKAKKTASATRYDFILNTLKIDRFNVLGALLMDKLNVQHIVMDSLRVQLVREELPYTLADTGDTDLYAQIRDAFKELRIDMLEVRSLDLEAIDKRVKEPLRLQKGYVRLSDFLLGPDSKVDSSRLFYCKRVEIELPGFTYSIAQSPYQLAFDHLKLDSRSQSALLHNIRLGPKIKKEQYFKNDKQNTALIALQWDTLRVAHWDMPLLLREGTFYAKKIFLNKGSAVFRKDRRYQKDNVNKIGDGPHQQIMKLKQRIAVDTIFVAHSLVQYRQINESGSDEGVLSFEGTRGIISNVTNDKVRLRKDGFMRADLNTMLMGKGDLHAVFGFDMLSNDGAHSYKGSLGAMGATSFNQILTPLLNLKIASGNIRSINFDMKGDDHRNWGDFRFDYNDFKVEVLGDLSGGKRKKKGIVSFFVNTFVINDSNPDANGVYHVGKVNHERVPEYSHFKSIWKSLQEGIQQCVGM